MSWSRSSRTVRSFNVLGWEEVPLAGFDLIIQYRKGYSPLNKYSESRSDPKNSDRDKER